MPYFLRQLPVDVKSR